MEQSKEPTRISTMAHLFLSDIRAEKTASNEQEAIQNGTPVGRVRRIGPTGKVFTGPGSLADNDQAEGEQEVPAVNDVEEKEALPVSPVVETSQAEPERCREEEESLEVESESCATVVIGVHCNHLHWESNKALGQFARFLASQGKLVAVLKLEAWSANLRIYYRKSDPPKIPSLEMRDAAPEEYVEDGVLEASLKTDPLLPGDFWSQLESVKENLGYVLISWGEEFGRFEPQINGLVDEVCVIASPERKHMISTYQFLKSIGKQEGVRQPMGIFVADVDSFNEAQDVFSKLSRTAKDFAGLTVENYGYSLSEGAVVQELLSRSELRDQPERWFDGLVRWFKGQTNKTERHEPKEADKADMIKEYPSKPEPAVKKVAQPTRSEEIRRTSETPTGEIMVSDLDPVVGKMAEAVGEKIVTEGELAEDTLVGFLRSLGLNCAKFVREDGAGTLVMVMMTGDDVTVPIWAAEHYPNREDQLVLVTDQPFGQIEKSLWVKLFNKVDIRRAIRGKMNGREVAIIG